MDYIQRLRAFSNKEVNRAATKLITEPNDSEDFRVAMGLVTDWRTLHEGVLAHFRPILEARAAELPNSLVVTRLKRIPTIIAKLKRRQKGMQLSTMQDIGGLRAVVKTIADARTLADRMSDVPPQFELKLPIRDYISNPAPSGYRGLHLVYTYRSQDEQDRNLDGLKIELQIRTRLQHIWATAVEIVGTFRRESLKSGEGDTSWLEFFRLVSIMIADLEDGELPAITPELAGLRDQLKVFDRISAYNVATKIILDPGSKEATYFVLTLNLKARVISGFAFTPDLFEQAVQEYQRMERENVDNKDIDTVLVAVESPADLKTAYPNYFADTRDFIEIVYGGHPPEETSSVLF